MDKQDQAALENEIESWQIDREKEIYLDSIFLNHFHLEKELQKLLSNNNIPLIIKAIEKYKLYQFINIDENTINLFLNTSS